MEKFKLLVEILKGSVLCSCVMETKSHLHFHKIIKHLGARQLSSVLGICESKSRRSTPL